MSEESRELEYRIDRLQSELKLLQSQFSELKNLTYTGSEHNQTSLHHLQDLSAVELERALNPDIGESLPYALDVLLKVVADNDASDLHLKTNSYPTVRIAGDLVPLGKTKLTADQCRRLTFQALSVADRRKVLLGQEVDASLEMNGFRFRVSAFRERGNISVAMRLVKNTIPSFKELMLPPVLEMISKYNQGLVLVTGPAGSGKSTTLAAIINYINETRPVHIVTVEDPIEYLHQDKLAFITQREVGKDTSSYASAVRESLRQDPNVIMLGELRDKETIATAVTAAETGHLVLATMHTPSTVQSVDRLIETFSGPTQKQMRVLLANCLKAVVGQKLLKRVQGGLVCATEVLINTSTIGSYILEGRTHEIYPYIEQGATEGMHTFTQSLAALVSNQTVTRENALSHSINPLEFRMASEQNNIKTVGQKKKDYLDYL